MRLFIAVDVDDAAKAAIAAEQRRIAAAIRDGSRSTLKWARTDHMHLTLVFLGEIAEAPANQIIDAMQRSVNQPVFDLVFDGIGVFPPDVSHGAPRVVWLGVAAGAAEVALLQRELATRVERVGVALEDRAFHPHLTLGRWRRSRPSDRRRVLAAARRGAIARGRVDHATLYQSRLSSAGSTYTALARANLIAD